MKTSQSFVRELAAEVTRTVEASPRATFDVFRPIDLVEIMRGRGPLPAVVAVEDQVGDWDAAGQTRRLRLSDGSSLDEELTKVESPHHFAYRITRITGPFRYLTAGMSGAWWFEVDATNPERTRARWRYVFEPRSAWTRPLAALVVRVLWQPYMARVLERASDRAEARRRATSLP